MLHLKWVSSLRIIKSKPVIDVSKTLAGILGESGYIELLVELALAVSDAHQRRQGSSIKLVVGILST